MKHLKIKWVLSACMSLTFFFFLGTLPVLSEETIPKSEGVKVVPVRPGEEIPDWVARLELARVLGYAKRYDEAIAEYEKVLQEKPDLMEAKIELAEILFWNGDHKAAVRILEQVPPEEMTGDTKVLWADLLVAQEDYAKAEPLYRAYLEGQPGDQDVRLKLADVLSWQKKYDASLAEFRKILEARPDDIQVRRKYAFVLMWAGRHAEAASELKKTLE
ncbi:MAG TPA: tetratricopeptide repeat protein [Desulfobacteraceae bacterium]|nr:tetratricopeptide repeat protein [Desulfobacteraceae bacterium]